MPDYDFPERRKTPEERLRIFKKAIDDLDPEIVGNWEIHNDPTRWATKRSPDCQIIGIGNGVVIERLTYLIYSFEHRKTREVVTRITRSIINGGYVVVHN